MKDVYDSLLENILMVGIKGGRSPILEDKTDSQLAEYLMKQYKRTRINPIEKISKLANSSNLLNAKLRKALVTLKNINSDMFDDNDVDSTIRIKEYAKDTVDGIEAMVELQDN